MSQIRTVGSDEEAVFLRQAAELIQKGDGSKAISSIEEGLNKFPNSPILVEKKSQILLEQERYDEVVDLINNIEEAPLQLYMIKGKALCALDKKEEALELYENIKEGLSNSDLELLNDLDKTIAKIHLDQARFNKALDIYKLILKSDQSCVESLKAIWFIYEVNGNHQDSVDFHNELLEGDAYNKFAWYNIAHAHNHLQKPKEAIHAFEMCLTIDEDFNDANWFLSLTLKEIGDYEQAIEKLNRHYELMGDKEPLILIELAECYLATENFSFTYYYATKYLEFDEESWQSYLYRGLSLVHFANHVEAIENYEKALEIKPKEANIHTNLGFAYYHVGNHKKAFSHLLEAMDLVPDSLQNWLFAIEFLIRHEEIKSAIHLCNNAFEIFKDPITDIYKASCYFSKGDTINAYKCLEDFEEITKEYFEIILSICPSLFHDKQFGGFYRFCKGNVELPVLDKSDQDLPDGFFDFDIKE